MAPLQKYYWLPLENPLLTPPWENIIPVTMIEYVPEEAARRAGGDGSLENEDSVIQVKMPSILTFPWTEVYFAWNSSNKPFTCLQDAFSHGCEKQRAWCLWWDSVSLAAQPFPSCCKMFWLKKVTFSTSFEGAQPANSVKALGQKNVQLMSHAHSWLQPTVQQVHGSSWTLGCSNALIGLYRTKLRCKKYYQRIFFHFVDTVVGNTWLLYLLYLNHCNDLGLQESKQLCLLEFKYFISPALAKEGQVVNTKRVKLLISVEEILTVKNWNDTTQQHKWFRRKLWQTTM